MKEDSLSRTYVIAFVAAFLIYLLRRYCFEMITVNRGLLYYGVTYAVSLAIVIYLHIRYQQPNRFKVHLLALVYAGLLSFFLFYTSINMQMLCYAAVGESKTTTLKIDSVQSYRVKKTIEGSLIFVTYENQSIKFESSGANYFALKDKKQIQTVIGRAGAKNFYVSKIYWQDGEKWKARSIYWKYRLDFLKYVLAIFLIMGLGAILIRRINKGRERQYKPLLDFKTSPMKVTLILFGVLMAIGLLIYICLFLYMHFKYGFPRNS